MREKMMNKDYAKAFKTIVIMAVLLALLSAVVIPLSLSQQISDLSSLRQTSQEQTAQQDGEHSEHHADREELWKSQITPPTAGRWRPSAASRSSGWRLEFITGCWSPRGFIRAR